MRFDDTTNESAEYAAFIDKFKPKKTTDDCYTPANIYAVVHDWAVSEYALAGRKVLRPFYPGGDYEREEYPEGCVVIDNPPFSILSSICRFYDANGVDYFLFAPALTLFSTNSGRCNYIITDSDITYENGATVRTGFVTNLGHDKVVLAPDLGALIKSANGENTKRAVELPKYEYPDHVITAATLGKIVKRGIGLRIAEKDATFIRAMDHQRTARKAIFGGGFLLSDKAAADKAAAVYWELSERELNIVAGLGSEELVST